MMEFRLSPKRYRTDIGRLSDNGGRGEGKTDSIELDYSIVCGE